MSSAFQGAHDFTFRDIHFGATNYHHHGSKAAAVEKLREHIAAGAMHDSAERCDAPKCHPETRVAVQDEIVGWILHGDDEERPKKILWVTGPAGAGKTAIMGSVCDTCQTKGLLGGGFFFSSFAKSTNRRTKTCLIATLAYQVVQHDSFYDVGERILSSIDRNPAIFERQLDVQLEQLLLQPFRESRSHPDSSVLPKVIIIDGLDECEAEQYADITRLPHEAPRTSEADQTEILSTLLKATNDPHFPFRIVIASRPEPAMESFFADIAAHTTRKIFLDETYNPDADMTLFVEFKFANIRRQYQLPTSWPSEDVKQTLVQNASGQFIYVATVMRFLERSSAPPPELLERVLQLSVRDASTNPFASLDALYSHILGSCPNPLLTVRWLRLIFGTQRLESGNKPPSARFVRNFLESSPGEALHVFRGLNSVVSIPPADDDTSSYSLFHKSLVDFLRDEKRCRSLYLNFSDIDEFYARHYLRIWKAECQMQSLSSLQHTAFLDEFTALHPGVFMLCIFDLPPSHGLEQRLLSSNIAWWVRSQNEMLRNGSHCKSRHDHADNVSWLFFYAHDSCHWYRRCHPVCRHIRKEILKELQKLGWKTPGRSLRLRHRIFQLYPYEDGIFPPLEVSDTTRSSEGSTTSVSSIDQTESRN